MILGFCCWESNTISRSIADVKILKSSYLRPQPYKKIDYKKPYKRPSYAKIHPPCELEISHCYQVLILF
jgi:hypothetical protein